MKALRLLIAGACAASLAPAFAQNALQNADFTNDLNHWGAYGDVTVLGPTKRAVLSTATTFDDDDGLGVGFNNNSGVDPLDSFFALDLAGVSWGALDAASNGSYATEGSAIQQSFLANVGDIVNVSFTWAFLSLETVANDFAFVALNDSVVRFADAESVPAASVFNGTFGDFSNVTWNWNTGTFSYVANTSGVQSFALGLVDVGDFGTTSELRVDNINVSVVPEPETIAMLLAGLGVVGAAVRRRQQGQAKA